MKKLAVIKKVMLIVIVISVCILSIFNNGSKNRQKQAEIDRIQLRALNQEQFELSERLGAGWPKSLEEIPDEYRRYNEISNEIDEIRARHPDWTYEEIITR